MDSELERITQLKFKLSTNRKTNNMRIIKRDKIKKKFIKLIAKTNSHKDTELYHMIVKEVEAMIKKEFWIRNQVQFYEGHLKKSDKC